MKLLIIEDDHRLLRTYERIFHKHAVTTCTKGEEAVEVLSSTDFDCVLSDFNLEGAMTGGDVLDWIKEHRPTLVEKFIFCSANDKARRLHHRVFEKPFNISELVRALEGAA